MRLFVTLCAVNLAAAGMASAGPALSDIADQQMSFDAVDSSITGGPAVYTVTIDVEGENGGLLTSAAFTRWWGVEISPLSGGETLNCTVTDFGASDLILPVWSTSSDGTTFTTPVRIPGAVTNNGVATQEAYDFSVTVPGGATHVRLWKYFPYTIADKDALLASLPSVSATGPVRFSGAIGTSVEGLNIDMIELSNGSDDTGKHRIWIHAGIHSAETTSYFVVEGLVDFLLNSGTTEAQNLLDNCIIDIVPMLNPDGVARGNYRASAPNPSSWPNGADMEPRYNDGGLGMTDFSELQAVLTQIQTYNGPPPPAAAAPSANPVEVLLNLHSSHGSSWPFHFRHEPNYPTNGVLPAVTALEDQWISAFRARSPQFVDFGTNASSTLGSRGFVEAYMHDAYSAETGYTGVPNNAPQIMAITYEGTYQGGEGGTLWNTPADYRENGVDMALALADFFGVPVPVELSVFGTD